MPPPREPAKEFDDERSDSVCAQGQRPCARVVGFRRVHLRHFLDQPDHPRPVHLLLLLVFHRQPGDGGRRRRGFHDLRGHRVRQPDLGHAARRRGLRLAAANPPAPPGGPAGPRAGGDYVWQSRILGRGLGFLLAVTGWWFILWLWVPLYGQILSYEFLTPMAALLGAPETALWFSGSSEGLMLGMALVCVIVFIYIAVGMKWYARFQKLCFYLGMIGLALVFILLLTGNKESFIAGLNANLPALYGVPQGDYYGATIEAGQAAGTTFGAPGSVALLASFALIPMMVFFNLWPNWGSTLYGEVRGASDYKRNFW